MKRILFCLLSGIMVLTGCNNDDDATSDLRLTVSPLQTTQQGLDTNDFIWKSLNFWYFWQPDVNDLGDDRFATDEEYTEFLASESNPETFLRNLLFQEDRFTFWNEDYEVLLNSLSGVSKSNGLQFFIVDLTSDNSANLYGFVRNVVPGSTAAAAGLQRGDIFYGVNGQELTQNNYLDLLFDDRDSYILNMAEADVANRQVIQTSEEIPLDKIENFQEDPIRLARTLEVNGQKIGYLMYRQFNRNFNDELNNVFGQFAAEGVTDLVLDMRYNGGGSVNTSRLLASMIYGSNTDDLYIRQRWNDRQQERLSDGQLEDFFANTTSSGVGLNTLNLSRVYVLATERTASASELVMNGLDPYIEVIHIGTTTRGKNEFSISLVDDVENNYVYTSTRESNINPENRWIVQPLVGRNENAAGFFDYTAGFSPDIELEEDIFNLGTFGDPNEPLLARAIEEITGVSSKQASKALLQEPVRYKELQTPEMELMILDKPLNFK